jgi:hypothetical protein
MRKEFKLTHNSSNYVKVSLNSDKIDELVSGFMAGYITRVGILGGKTTRYKVITTRAGAHKAGKEEAGMTNAEIGAVHEFGSLSRHIKRRSFLEMPLVMHAEGLVGIKESLWKVFQQGSQTKQELKKAYVALGMLAENIVQTAFNTRGFGTWPKNADSTIARKHSDAPLVDSHQLARSITSDVVKK